MFRIFINVILISISNCHDFLSLLFSGIFLFQKFAVSRLNCFSLLRRHTSAAYFDKFVNYLVGFFLGTLVNYLIHFHIIF